MYTQNETIISNWEFFPATEEIISQPWYQEAMRNRGVISRHYLPDETKRDEKFLSLVRLIEFNNYKYTNVLVITVSKEQLHSVLSSESQQTVIVDDNDQIVASNVPSWSTLTLDEIFPHVDLPEYGTIETRMDDELVRITVEPIRPKPASMG